jgi:hypothetical protein
MRIGFTGHRNRHTDESELDRIAAMYPGAVWVHDDAKSGFDAQVKAYAIAHGIEQAPILPDYKKYLDKVAPIMRNYQIVDTTERLIACYDGVRQKGGTFYTVDYAQRHGKPIIFVVCKV